jgi:hypothetical protein
MAVEPEKECLRTLEDRGRRAKSMTTRVGSGLAAARNRAALRTTNSNSVPRAVLLRFPLREGCRTARTAPSRLTMWHQYQ